MTICKRRAIDRVRVEEAARRNLALDPCLSARAFAPADELALRRAEYEQVRRALRVLTVLQRASIILVYYTGRTAAGAAGELGIGVPAFKTRVRDGLIRLRPNSPPPPSLPPPRGGVSGHRRWGSVSSRIRTRCGRRVSDYRQRRTPCCRRAAPAAGPHSLRPGQLTT